MANIYDIYDAYGESIGYNDDNFNYFSKSTVENMLSNCGYNEETQIEHQFTVDAIIKECKMIVEYNGKTKSIKEWSKELNVNYWMLRSRYLRGWTAERMLGEFISE